MAAIRRATATWQGDLLSGSGNVSADTSKAFGPLPVTWASRTEEHEGRTSPEELVAAAHAACYSMAFANILAMDGSPPS
jgi:osmotically inducible protein OsmC